MLCYLILFYVISIIDFDVILTFMLYIYISLLLFIVIYVYSFLSC